MAPIAPPAVRSLLGLRGLDADRLRALVAAAGAELVSPPRGDELAGHVVANLFFEDSTRTRVSFSVAAQRLGASVVDLATAGSSVNKGESLIDTAATVAAMGVDLIVTRTRQSGGAAVVARATGVPVINAGDGRHEHPTQALADALVLAEATGRTIDPASPDLAGPDLSGLVVAIVGDLAASRVARSNAWCLTALGADVVLVGPAAMAPVALAGLGAPEGGCVRVERDLDAVLPTVDAVMALRVQFERGSGAALGARADYRLRYALTEARAAAMKDGAIIMHPGPMNRGLEIDSVVADGPRSVITRQVAAGVAARSAVLRWVLTGGV